MDRFRTFRRRIVFDDQGALWPADSIELRRRLYCINYPGQLILDLVRNLGFIAVDDDQGCVALRLRSSIVSRAAAIGLLYWLIERGQSRGYIHDLDGAAIELAPSQVSLVSRIGAIGNVGSMLDRAAEKPLDHRHLIPQSPLRELLRRWAEAGGKFCFEDYAAIIEEHLGSRFVLTRVTDNSRMIVVAVGNGLRIPNRSWFTKVVGSDLELQPDRAYGRWVKEAYAQVHCSQQPAISDCDADIYWPGEGWVRRKYRRLIIPGIGANGGSYLLSTNCTDAQISLRLSAA